MRPYLVTFREIKSILFDAMKLSHIESEVCLAVDASPNGVCAVLQQNIDK